MSGASIWDTGTEGPPGPPGPAATIAVGTVTTGPAGSTAIITNSGTVNNAVFDFVIPKGDQGIGIQGPVGPAGATVVGPVGPVGPNGQSSIIYSGAGAPSALLGTAIDYYFNTSSGIFYGPKGTTWPVSGTSLVGPTGPIGPQGPSGFFDRTNILGAVGQTAGVPTGAIIDHGSNANGQYTKWADGTMECRLIQPAVSLTVSTVYGTNFYATANWTFPIAFVGEFPVVSLEPYHSGTLCWSVRAGTNSLTAGAMAVIDNAVRGALNYELNWVARGRWFA